MDDIKSGIWSLKGNKEPTVFLLTIIHLKLTWENIIYNIEQLFLTMITRISNIGRSNENG